jgi:hypothetical protein
MRGYFQESNVICHLIEGTVNLRRGYFDVVERRRAWECILRRTVDAFSEGTFDEEHRNRKIFDTTHSSIN